MSTKYFAPKSYTQAVAAVTVKPRSPHQDRLVFLDSLSHRGYHPHLDVTGPTGEFDRLVIVTNSGFNHLRILSGNVHVTAGSSWGNPIEVTPKAAATTTIHVYPGIKATIEGPIARDHLDGDLRRAYWPTKYTRLADGSSVLTDSLVLA